MVSTVLYKKNGVITENRFRKLTPAQWLFHFVEISENDGNEDKNLLTLLEASNSTLSRDIRILYTLVGDNKEQVVSALDMATELDKKAKQKISGEEVKEDAKEGTLSKEDEELLEFMYSTPETVKMPNAMVREVSYILESKDINEILDDFTELPDENYSSIRRPHKRNTEVEEEIVEAEEEIVEAKEEVLIVDNFDSINEQIGLEEDIEEF